MSGTKAGGIKARGFASNPKLARKAGAKGGRNSKRGISAKRQKIYAILEGSTAEVMEMRRLGLNCGQIARKLKLPHRAVYAWICKKEGK